MIKYFIRYIFILSLFSLTCFSQSGIDLPDSIADPNAQIVDVKTGLGYSEGPAVDAAGNLFFTEHAGQHRIWKVTPEGEASVYRDPANNANGMEFAPDGKLVAAERGRLAKETSPGVWEALTPAENEGAIAGANDLSFSEGGSVYFTNLEGGSVFYLDSMGALTEFPGFNRPNGIEWIPEKGIVYIHFEGDRKIAQFDVQPDGSFDNRQDLADVNVPDGLTTDSEGNIYVASYGDGLLYVFGPDGTKLGSIDAGFRMVSNCVFGGPNGTTLYITGQGGVAKVELKIPGRVKYPGSTPIKKIFAQNPKLITRDRALYFSASSQRILLPRDLHPSVVEAFLLNAEGTALNHWRIGQGERLRGLSTESSMPYNSYRLMVFKTATGSQGIPLVGIK